MTSTVLVKDVSKYYGAKAAVADLNFSIEEGEVVGLLGLNGAGKTTTLAILSGLLMPTTGHAWVGGIDMMEDPNRARSKIGFLPEQPPLYLEMTVQRYLEFVAHIKGMREDDIPAALEDALAATDLLDARRERIGTLSNGYRKRVGIAQAVVHKPSLILLDEPSNSLDPVQVLHMRKLIRGLRGKNTIVVSSHLLGEIHEMCDRILVLQNGRVAAEGTEDALADRLVGTTRVSVEVRGAQSDLAKALSQVRKFSRHTVERECEGVTHVTVEMDQDDREELVRTLVQAGLGLRRLEPLNAELESIFLRVTQGSSTAPSAESRS